MILRYFPMSPGVAGIILITTTLVLVPCIAQASPYPAPSIFLHAQPVVAKNACGALNISDCWNVVTTGDLAQPDVGPFYHIYLLTHPDYEVSSVTGIRCGITYQGNQPDGRLDGQGVDIYSWHLCAPMEFPTPTPYAWPNPGSGNLIVWNSGCQTSTVVVAGYFYAGAYSADVLGVTPNPYTGTATMADCVTTEHVLPTSRLGQVAFSAGETDYGCNGCLGGCPTLLFPPPAPGPTALSLHLAPPPVSQPTCSALGAISCDTLNVSGTSSGAGEHYYAYVVASIGGLQGLTSVRFGLDYGGGAPGSATNGEGIDILSWARCGVASTFTSAGWPNPGSGIVISWDYSSSICPDQGATIPVGYFYMSAYSADILRLTRYSGQLPAALVDCPYEVTTLSAAQLGQAAVSPDGSLFGCRPCIDKCDEPTPVVRSTWGSIKNLFGRD